MATRGARRWARAQLSPVDGGTATRRLAWGQGAWWAATGAWPLVHLPSFYAVTGPKREGWLVRTVGVLVLAIGGALLAGAARGRVAPELRLLGATAAGGVAAVEFWYAGARRRIAPIYLADAVLEAGVALAWLGAARPRHRRGEEER
jgi:hypothetical protein